MGIEDNILFELSQAIDIQDIKNQQIVALVNAVKAKNFNLALRLTCAHFNLRVLSRLTSYNAISFNPLEESSNKKNAYDWLQANKKINEREKNEMKYFIEGLKNNEVKNLSPF